MLTLIAVMILAPAEAASPNAATKDDPIICTRRGEHTVGTRMKPKRTCMRKSDWDYIENQSQREIQNLRDLHLSPGRTGYDDRGGPN